jgi:hypothetical protein
MTKEESAEKLLAPPCLREALRRGILANVYSYQLSWSRCENTFFSIFCPEQKNRVLKSGIAVKILSPQKFRFLLAMQ